MNTRTDRIIAIKLATLALLTLAGIIWMLTHPACAHPIENGIAAITSFIIAPLAALNAIEHAQTSTPPNPSNHCTGSMAATRTVEKTN